ncbi:phasin family protein [Motiliproteus coralliicola]|uniref:Phasin family protein n=1 Tax=Motiliproteus coralliicola TaxID=2283196 RepID=A0A369WSR0_9GAMM|nr:phasin family protein [Motiliproteus coralliicola]RDE22515.1 phasin family protein [Motiliproteus coralliicola]
MYDQMLAEMKTRMQPVLDLAETNKKVMETMANVQKEAMTDVVNASMEQMQELAKCQDPKAAFDLQVKFYKALEAKMADTTEKNMAALNEAKDAFTAVVESSAKQAAAEVEEAVQKVSAQVKVA